MKLMKKKKTSASKMSQTHGKPADWIARTIGILAISVALAQFLFNVWLDTHELKEELLVRVVPDWGSVYVHPWNEEPFLVSASHGGVVIDSLGQRYTESDGNPLDEADSLILDFAFSFSLTNVGEKDVVVTRLHFDSSNGGPSVFIATAESFDPDAEERIFDGPCAFLRNLDVYSSFANGEVVMFPITLSVGEKVTLFTWLQVLVVHEMARLVMSATAPGSSGCYLSGYNLSHFLETHSIDLCYPKSLRIQMASRCNS
jgi:hypothetical protein